MKGFYRLLREAVFHTSSSPVLLPPKKCHPAPTVTVSQLPPWEPEKVASKVSGLITEKGKQALGIPSLVSSKAPEKTIPTHMQPLCLQLGGIKRVCKCQFEGCTEGHQSYMPQSAHMCTECIWQWGWYVPSVTNLSSTQMHSGATGRVILVSKSSGVLGHS